MSFLIVFSIFYLGINLENVEGQTRTQTQSSTQKSCCQLTKNNDACVYTNRVECDTSNGLQVSNSKCEDSSFCSNVCCLESEGCYPNTPKGLCKGTQVSDSTCNSENQCKQGCCILGGQYSFTYENECKKLADNIYGRINYNFGDVFKETETEFQCLSLSLNDKEGCCVSSNVCKYGTKASCEGDFNLNSKCSSLNECDSCKSKSYKDCNDGNVYWYDSCGNKESLVQECDYEKGFLCAKENENVFCKSLDCKTTTKYDEWDYTGKERKHGESWCVYESPTGDFTDRPGSVHYRFSCINGEEVPENCGDYRKQVCLQANFNNSGFSQAGCVNNNIYSSTLTSNISSVSVGNKFWENENKIKDQCKKGSTTCTVYYVKKNRVSNFECKGNCFCETQQFIDDANNYCKSFGDCGFNYNILNEEGSKGLNVFWTGANIGNKPTTFTQNYLDHLKSYGIYGGMSYLDSEAERILNSDKPEVDDYEKILIYGGIGFFLSGVLTQFLISVATLSLSEVFGTIGIGYLGSGLTGGLSSSISTAFTESASSGATAATSTTNIAGQGGAAAADASVKTYYTHAALSSTPQATTTPLTAGDFVFAGLQMFAYVAAVVAAIIIIVTTVLAIVQSGGEVKQKTINIKCEPWKAPLGGKDCGKCSDDPNKECTEYRCRSLGTTCKLVNEQDLSKIRCVDSNPNDVNSPRINPMQLQAYSITTEQYGYRINEDVEPIKPFNFGILSDEESDCKFDLNATTKYEDMVYEFGDGFFNKRHNMTLILEGSKNYKFFVKCIDIVGNDNDASYQINFKTKKGLDKQVPIISTTEPKNNAILPNYLNFATVDLELNEPATCRHDVKDKKYDEMGNQSSCNNEFSLIPTKYKCNSGITGLNNGPNAYFFKCRDLSNNTNTQSYVYTLIRSEILGISVDSNSPKDAVNTNDVTLSITTKAGSETGKSSCRYSTRNIPYENMIEFKVTNSNQHLQSQTNLKNGNYDYFIKCRDNAGNEAKEKISFKILRDNIGSEIIYFYKDNSNLYVVLNSDSSCEYDNKQFTFGTGKKMDGDKTTVHTAPLEFNEYYIECKDDTDKDVQGIRINV